VTSEYEANNQVPIHILLPHGQQGPFPVVVVLHYWGAMNRNVERALGQELNKRGIAAVLMTLPYHLERTPQGSRSGELAIQPDIDQLNQTLLQSLQDTRRAIDYIDSRPEFDHNKIGITGLSLGAIVTALVYGVDTRISHAAFVLGGVDIAHILWNSSRVVPQREELRRKGFTEEKLRDALKDLEPGTFLKERQDTDAFVVAARYDTVIPPKSTQELIDDLKQPKISWMNTGHFGGVFVQKRLLDQTCDYFESAFNNTSFEPMSNLGAPTVRLGVEYGIGQGMDIGFGADVFSTGKEREYAATLLASPRGLRLFFGRRAGKQLSVGAVLDRRHLSAGVLWSTVL
jgi:dienelactone hydrolase